MGYVVDVVNYLLENPAIILTAVLLYVFIFALSAFFSTPKPGPNPFRNDTTRAPGPLVTDLTARDKVLKQGFQAKKLPDKPDAIVIGSGIGGLAASVVLAKAGKKVLVLEQHDQAGGCCHSFIEKGFEFDVGIHYIGEMRNNTIARLLVNQVTDGQLQWVDLDDDFDVVALGEPGKQRFIPFRSGGREKWKAAMLEHFPAEEKALDGFLDLLVKVRQNMLGMVALKMMSKWYARILVNTGLIHRVTKYFSYSQRNVFDTIGALTDNPDLRAVLAYSFGDYGCAPKQSSFAMHAALINHYLYGGSYPLGGASEIAFHMIPLIEKTGGKVLVRAPVTNILTNDAGRVVGVRVHKGTEDYDIYAPTIISDAGVVNTFTKLLPTDIAVKSSIHRLLQSKRVESGSGAMSLFVGLRGTKEELGLKGQNIWAYTSNELDKITTDYLNIKSGEEAAQTEVPLLFISFPSAKDPTFNDRFPGKSTCTIVTLANWRWFQEWENERVMKRGENYERIKNDIGDRMWEQALAIFPQLRDKVEYFNVGSPVSNKYYLGSPHGEVYGLDHTAKRFGSPEVMMTLRPETDIPGLLLTGQDVFSCGFMGGLFGGILAGSKLLNRNVYEDLIELRKKLQKQK